MQLSYAQFFMQLNKKICQEHSLLQTFQLSSFLQALNPQAIRRNIQGLGKDVCLCKYSNSLLGFLRSEHTLSLGIHFKEVVLFRFQFFSPSI